MKHYFTRLEEAIKACLDGPALGNFRGELFTFGQFATQIAKFHIFFEKIGVKTIIFTDISRDGTLSGPNLEMLGELSRTVSCDIIASGGLLNSLKK